MMQWYYTIGAQAYGPVSNEVIRDLANRGVLGPNSNVLPQGAASWTSLRVHEAAIGLVRNRGGDYTGTQLLTAAYSSSPPPPPPPPGYQQYRGSISSARLGSWWARAAALGLDGVIVGVPLNILVTVLGLRRFELTKYNKFDGTSGLHVHWGGVSLAILFGGMFIYNAILNGKGQTLGKKALHLHVIDVVTGQPIGTTRAAGRYLMTLAFALACGVGTLLDVLWPLWDRQNQTLHDKVVQSMVVIA